jgi:uncharacterized protein
VTAGDAAIRQYTVREIALVWAAAALPMGILGWIVAPALVTDASHAAVVRLATLTVGLIWQFALVLIVLKREAGTLAWSTIKSHLWLATPRSPTTGMPRARLWWWLVPVIAATAVLELVFVGPIDHAWLSLFPSFAEPPGYSLGAALGTPEARAGLHGAWGFLALFVVCALFNTVLGEELLFRGVLLPRMAGAFGKWDWLANGLLFGAYHLHQPWGMLNSVIEGTLCFALPSRYYRSAWFGIAAHSGQSIYFTILIMAVVL